MSAPAVAEIRTERLTLRQIEVGDVASFAYERKAEFHGRTVELFARES